MCQIDSKSIGSLFFNHIYLIISLTLSFHSVFLIMQAVDTAYDISL